MTLRTSVVVCAYTMRRSAEIAAAIASLQAQVPVPAQIVLVVDHNEELLQWARRSWPELAVVPNTGPQGLSGARNTGIALCTGDVVAFLDDDAAARPGWLRWLTDAYTDPTVTATGGVAVPVWPCQKQAGPAAAPTMLPPELLWVVGCTYQGQPTTTTDVRNVMGCSMSFRATVLTTVGGFVDGIGRQATLPLGCEETELCIRITQHDPAARIVFEPRAVVDHHVSADRTTWRYLARRSWAEGVSKAAISRLVGAHSALSTERDYTRRVLPRAITRELRHAHLGAAAAIPTSVTCAAVAYLRGRRTTPTPTATPLPTADSPGLAT